MAGSIGNKVAPGLLDLLSGLAGVVVQHTDRQDVRERRDPNTFGPSTRPAGTHGPFDGEALGSSIQWWMSKNPAVVGLTAGLVALGMLGAIVQRVRR